MTQRPQPDRYVVEGRGPFPLDMLQKDCAEPATDEDRAKIDATYETGLQPRERRRVTLVTREPRTVDERWESFGWRVIRPLRPWMPHAGYTGPEPDRDVIPEEERHVVTMRVVCKDARTAWSVQRAMSEAARPIEGTSLEPSCIEPYREYRAGMFDDSLH